MIIIDGKKIAEEIKNFLKQEIAKTGKKLKLAIVQVGPVRSSQSKIDADMPLAYRTSNGIGDDPSKIFVKQKVKFAEEIGVKTKIYELPAEISTNQLRKKMAEICKNSDGVIIQLPLPEHINTQYILNSIPQKKDVDVLSAKSLGDFTTGKSKVLPPVIGAVKNILDKHNIGVAGKNIAIIGAGILVGKPAMIWFINQGATVFILRRSTQNISKYTKEADIIVMGVGKPGLIKPEMIKDGVIIIDAGTSSQSSVVSSQTKIVGDVAPEVAEKASLFTPVPGGIGPITVAIVFKNLLELNRA